jgi:beta propeller repeat protein
MNPAIDLTNTPNENEFLEDIDGNNVIWTHSGASMPGDIVLYDLSSNTATTLATSTAATYFQQPAIGGRYVVYLRVGSQTDVDGYDLALGLPFARTVTNDAALQARPRVGGDVIVYEDYSSGHAAVVGYHIASGTFFSVGASSDTQTQPDVDGNTIVWVAGGSGGDQIWSYDLTSGTAHQLTTVSSHKIEPRISGSRVVWADDRSGNLDVYTYDLAAGVEDLMVGGPGDQLLSDIDGNRVVYTDNASGFQQIYLFTIAAAPPPPPVPLGCDPAKTNPVDGPYTMTRTTNKTVFTSHSFLSSPGKNYYVCVQNGLADGSERTAQFIFVADGQLILNPSDFKPNNDPPAYVAAQLFTKKSSPAAHQWTASLFGAKVPAQVVVTVRVGK